MAGPINFRLALWQAVHFWVKIADPFSANSESTATSKTIDLMWPIPILSVLTGVFSICFFSTFSSVGVRLYSKDFFFYSFLGTQAVSKAKTNKSAMGFFMKGFFDN